MRPITLALLGTVAFATMPYDAIAQTAPAPAPAAAPSLNEMLGCENDDESAVPTAPGGTAPGATPTPGATPAPGGTPAPGATPGPGSTPTPGAPLTPAGNGGPTAPVGGTPTGGPIATPVPPTGPGPAPVTVPPPVGGGGNDTPVYYTGGGGLRSSVVTDVLGTRTVYRASSNAGSSYQRDLPEVNSYSATTRGIGRTVGGQRIGVASSGVSTTGLKPQIVNIIDEIVLSARAVGMPDPVITSGTDGVHTATSLHGQGLALDLRCNDVSATLCKKWVAALKNAIGPGYDVYFEDWGGPNTHVHLEYDGKTGLLTPVPPPYSLRVAFG